MTTTGGRLAPHREPCPGGVMRLYGAGSVQVRAVCDGCGEARTFDGGHPVEDFVRLEAMHGRTS